MRNLQPTAWYYSSVSIISERRCFVVPLPLCANARSLQATVFAPTRHSSPFPIPTPRPTKTLFLDRSLPTYDRASSSMGPLAFPTPVSRRSPALAMSRSSRGCTRTSLPS